MYLMSQVIKDAQIGKISIGKSQKEIQYEFNDYSLVPSRISKRSKLFVMNYKNISFTLEDGKIIAIQINLEKEGVESIITDDKFINFSQIDDWCLWAQQNNWDFEKISDVYRIEKAGISLFVDKQGGLHLISIH